MSITEIQMYNALKLKLGEKEAQELVEFVKHEVKDELEARTNIFLTKEDKADIIKWMFIFWAGQIGVLIAILALFFK